MFNTPFYSITAEANAVLLHPMTPANANVEQSPVDTAFGNFEMFSIRLHLQLPLLDMINVELIIVTKDGRDLLQRHAAGVGEVEVDQQDGGHARDDEYEVVSPSNVRESSGRSHDEDDVHGLDARHSQRNPLCAQMRREELPR